MLDPDCHRPEFVCDIPKRQDQTEVTDNTREGIDDRTAIRVSRVRARGGPLGNADRTPAYRSAAGGWRSAQAVRGHPVIAASGTVLMMAFCAVRQTMA